MIERAIIERARRAIVGRVFPGCVVGAVSADGRRVIVPVGNSTYEEGSGAHEVRAATVYDLASITKSIPLASLASLFVDEGRFRLSDAVIEYLPELYNDYGATIEDLLRYRVRGVQLSTLRHLSAGEIRTFVLNHGFDGPPGESVYTNFPALILGMIIERVGEASVSELGARYFFEPLDMKATTYFPNPVECAPTELDERGEVCGLPHDESAYQFALAHQSAGHAGMFSTAPDLLNFLHALLYSADVGHPMSYISEGAAQGLGWQTTGDFFGSHASPGSFGKTGFTGTSVCVDVQKGRGFVILSNRTYPKRPPDDHAIHTFRSDIADIILST